MIAAAASFPSAHAQTSTVVFEDRTAQAGLPLSEGPTWGATWVDYNGNGWADLFINRHKRRPKLFRSEEGRFDRVFASWMRATPEGQTYFDRHSCAWGEATGNRKPDLYCLSGAHKGAGVGPNQLIVKTRSGWRNQAAERGLTDEYGRGRSLNWLDFDSDFDLDVFIGNEYRAGHPNVLLRNDGGSFTRVTSDVAEEKSTSSSAWSDWDRDGDPDLVRTGYWGRVGSSAFVNNEGHFVETQILEVSGEPWNSAVFGDYDGDGWTDLLLVASSRLAIMRNAEGTFVRAHRRRLTEGATANYLDVDNDGDLDVFVVQGWSDEEQVNVPDMILLNDDGNFSRLSDEGFAGPATGDGESVVVGDHDRSGTQDVFVLNGDWEIRGTANLLANKTPAGNFVTLILKGPHGNPFGFGSRVQVRSAGLIYERELNDGVTYRSQSQVGVLHLGLGDADRARITVTWPISNEQDCVTAPAGTLVIVRKGSTDCP